MVCFLLFDCGVNVIGRERVGFWRGWEVIVLLTCGVYWWVVDGLGFVWEL